jgi:hypothetical protein
VIQEASSEQISATALPMSAGVPSRPIGVQPRSCHSRRPAWKASGRLLKTLFDPAWADGVDGDAAARQRDGEIAQQNLQSCFRGAHCDPGLPTSEASAGRETYGDDPSAIRHHWSYLAHADQECFGLRIHRGVPLFQRDVQGRLVEGGSFGTGIVDENVERAEFGADLLEEAEHLLGPANVGLDEKSIGAECADFFQGRLRGALVSVVR